MPKPKGSEWPPWMMTIRMRIAPGETYAHITTPGDDDAFACGRSVPPGTEDGLAPEDPDELMICQGCVSSTDLRRLRELSEALVAVLEPLVKHAERCPGANHRDINPGLAILRIAREILTKA